MKISGKLCNFFIKIFTILLLLCVTISKPLAENPDVLESQEQQENHNELVILGLFIVSGSAASVLFFSNFDKDEEE